MLMDGVLGGWVVAMGCESADMCFYLRVCVVHRAFTVDGQPQRDAEGRPFITFGQLFAVYQDISSSFVSP